MALPELQPASPRRTLPHRYHSEDIIIIDKGFASLLLEGMVHIFFPKRTPETSSENLEEVEEALLACIADYTQVCLRELEEKEWKTVETLKQWKNLQTISRANPVTFPTAFQCSAMTLQNRKLAFYVRKQNCMIIISSEKDSYKIETFRASLPSEIVMSNVGSLTVEYPHTFDISDNFSLLQSTCFAEQLSDLSETEYEIALPTATKGGQEFAEVRDPAEPILVSDWVVGVLAPKPVNDRIEFRKIKKKVRDTVTWNDSPLPFRRSGLWMSLKVTLQLCLLDEFDEKQDAKVVYKAILLRAMTDLCNFFASVHPSKLNGIHEMLQKIDRRATKLGELKASNVSVVKLQERVIQVSNSVVQSVHFKIETIWRSLSSSVETQGTVNLLTRTIDDFKTDLNHDIPRLNLLINERKLQKGPLLLECGGGQEIAEIVRFATIKGILKYANKILSSFPRHNTAKLEISPHSIWMYDAERFARNIHATSTTSKISPHDLCTLMKAYAQVTTKHADRPLDPISFNRMVLTLLLFLQKLDKLVVEKYPLLCEYQSGVNPSIFQDLLLPDATDLEFFDKAEDYFRARNTAAKHPSLISKCEIDDTSFSVRFATSHDGMTKLRVKLVEGIFASTEEKFAEILQTKLRVQYLQNVTTEIPHDIYTDPTGAPFHLGNCRVCQTIKNMNWTKHSVSKYEITLPTEIHLQYAVIFELLIPSEIAALRDALALVMKEILGDDSAFQGDNRELHTLWCGGYHPLSQFQMRPNPSQFVKLGSSCKPVSATHYMRGKNPDVMTADRDSFIVKNGMNCRLYYTNKLDNYSKPPHGFSFDLSATTSGWRSNNKTLQTFVSGTDLSQNAVISRHHHFCYKRDMRPAEFLAFGSLRAGHRIQLRNLYRFLHEKSLPIETESGLALVIQVIWSVGPLEPCFLKGEQQKNLRRRANQEDFYNPDFATEFLKLLERLWRSTASNWNSPLTLLTIVMITTRILDMNDNQKVRKICGHFLRLCRQSTEAWIGKLEALLSSEAVTRSKTEERQFLGARLLGTLLCSGMTYNVTNPDAVKVAISSSADVEHWLHTIHKMKRSMEEEEVYNSFSPFMKRWLRFVREIIAFNIEHELHEKLGEGQSLTEFVTRVWNPPGGRVTSTTKLEWERRGHFYKSRWKGQDENMRTFHIYLLQGTLLIDGYPPSYLPSEIRQHPAFLRAFGPTNFLVQREFSNTFVTEKIIEKFYKFSLSDGGALICKEYQNLNENIFLELVDPQIFQDILPQSLLNNCTHWLDFSQQVVHCRQKYSPGHGQAYQYTLSQVSNPNKSNHHYWRLRDESQGSDNKFLMSIKSEGYHQISHILSRLELPSHISITVDTKKNEIFVHLSRMGLHFLAKDNLLTSLEYPGYYIPSKQSLGTLIQLEHGLLLECQTDSELSGVKHLILIPHGDIETDFQPEKLIIPHQITRINLDSLRQPPFFVFEVDQVLRRLKADKSKSAWLYLAALHATTSSCLPDPFTGLTGAEMAMWILQSGFVWSSCPYDAESKTTLKYIQSLSPKREYYPQHLEKMEKVTWPALATYAAYDGYALVVKKLLSDSERLKALFQHQSEDSTANLELTPSEPKLLLRDYLRTMSNYNEAAHVDAKTMTSHLAKPRKKSTKLQLPIQAQSPSAHREMALARKELINSHPSNPGIIELLRTAEPLPGNQNDINIVNGRLKTWLSLDIRNDWLALYTLAHSSKERNLENLLTLVLSALAYKGVSKAHLLNLHFISLFAQVSDLPPPTTLPFSGLHFTPLNSEFNEQEIHLILRSAAVPFMSMWQSYSDIPDYTSAVAEHERRISWHVDSILGKLKILMAAGCPSPENIGTTLKYTLILPHDALVQTVFSKLLEWQRNKALNAFLEAIEKKLKTLSKKLKNDSTAVVQVTDTSITILTQKHLIRKSSSNNLFKSVASIDKTEFANSTLASYIYTSGNLPVTELPNLKETRELCYSMYNTLFRELQLIQNFRPLSSRLVPILLFRNLLNKNVTSEKIQNYIGSLAVLFTHIKRLNRCIKYENKGSLMEMEFKRELENEGHSNWSPKERPEWLLLELELDLMIRPVQVKVAQQMMNMPDERNGVMQLNMGEGKTSLIVPMLVSVMANSETLSRVTVLNPIFKTNLDILSFAIGGLLNRRVYVVPCRRDAKVGKNLETIWEVYKECLERQGVVLTLPEYRLSLRLMIYEKLLKNKEKSVEVGLNLLELENWLRKHARDILDESDELLNAKYQLIYTIGEQVHIDGGDLRWTTCQKILDLVPGVLYKLSVAHGSTAVELKEEEFLYSPEQFPFSRIVNEGEEFKNEFYSSLADEILRDSLNILDVSISAKTVVLLKAFLINAKIPPSKHMEVMRLFKDDVNLFNKILLISGYLRRGILYLALSKRWRVEYGVHPKGRRAMAVPFKAKDVPAERTEFGHPDVAIILTHLSYYYSGLSDEQLTQCFEILETTPGPESVYQEWISKIPKSKVDKSISTYEGVNLRDFVQRTKHLFPVLRKSKATIDFWLGHKVFPKESKQFPGKITTTAWDLCYERNSHPTCGFSGTNDSSILLPLPITQQDLPELLETNRKVEEILKRPENSCHKHLKMGVSCKEILQALKVDGIQVLIDAGALMLELSNEQVAQLWLQVDKALDGVVYFSQGNQLLVKVRMSNSGPPRKGKRKKKKVTVNKLMSSDIPLELSPYRERLDKCAIYLDDQHTRGTDLRMPNGFKACVTVGSKMKRDKLIQASMRMRKLGEGHSLSFYLSHETYTKVTLMAEKSQIDSLYRNGIKTKTTSEVGNVSDLLLSSSFGGTLEGSSGTGNLPVIITTDLILNWVKNNSSDFEKEGIVHWALAGKNYVQKLVAEDVFQSHHKEFGNSSIHKNVAEYLKEARVLGQQCSDNCTTSLFETYGVHQNPQLVVNVIDQIFRNCKLKLVSRNGADLPQKIHLALDTVRFKVLEKSRAQIPTKINIACLDEEHEKELEPEHEEIARVERPQSPDPARSHLHKSIVEFAKSGKVPFGGVHQLPQIFESTSIWPITQPECWSPPENRCPVLVSADFVQVLKNKGQHQLLDGYLRPISFLLSMTIQSKIICVLVISPFEANELTLLFKLGLSHPHVRLHMFSPRSFENQDILINNPRLQLPPSQKPSGSSQVNDEILAKLLIASGNLFFCNLNEQRAFMSFLGIIPRPWTTKQNAAFEAGSIAKNGFVCPIYRERSKKEGGEEEESRLESNFTLDPTNLVRRILECRHLKVGEKTHVFHILTKGTLVSMEK